MDPKNDRLFWSPFFLDCVLVASFRVEEVKQSLQGV